VGVYKAPGPIRPFRARAGRRAAAALAVAGAETVHYGLMIDQVMNCSKNCRSQELQGRKRRDSVAIRLRTFISWLSIDADT